MGVTVRQNGDRRGSDGMYNKETRPMGNYLLRNQLGKSRVKKTSNSRLDKPIWQLKSDLQTEKHGF